MKKIKELEEKIENVLAYAEYIAEQLDKQMQYTELEKYAKITQEIVKMAND